MERSFARVGVDTRNCSPWGIKSGLGQPEGKSNTLIQENRDSGKSTPTKGKRKPSKGNKFITRLDKDGDCRISAAEFKRSKKRFKRFDKNNDGYISEDETPTGPPIKRRG